MFVTKAVRHVQCDWPTPSKMIAITFPVFRQDPSGALCVRKPARFWDAWTTENTGFVLFPFLASSAESILGSVGIIGGGKWRKGDTEELHMQKNPTTIERFKNGLIFHSTGLFIRHGEGESFAFFGNS
jgi:hypothetical protein